MEALQYAAAWDFTEHQAALKAVSHRNLRQRPGWRLFRLSFPLLLLGIVFGPAWLRGELSLNTAFFVALSPWLILLAFWFWLIRSGEFYFAARRTRRLDPAAKGTLTRVVSDAGFRVEGPGQAVDLQWEGVAAAAETPDFLLVYYNKQCAYYLPKRLIHSPDELARIRTLLKLKLGTRAELLE